MKVPEPRKLPSGNYFIQMRLNGVSVPVTAPTAKECKRQAELIKAEHRTEKRDITPHMDETLGEMCDKYISSRLDVRSPSTIRGYKKIRNTHFQNEMDKRPSKINWQRMISADSKKYGPKSVSNAWTFVCSALKENGYQKPNVVLPALSNNTRSWLDAEQIPVFMDSIQGDTCEIAALLGLHSLRMSEILGLTWDDIDLKNGIIHIRGAVVIGENDKPIYKTTNKNLTSRRDVPIMIPRLKELLLANKSANGPVVPYRDCTVYNHVIAACERSGLPRVSPHGLRHSFASLALHLGMSERECMEIGGWSNPVTMHRIYQHLSSKDRLKAENKMADFYKNANKSANENQKT